MNMHPMAAEMWRSEHFPGLREAASARSECPVALLLEAGLEWRTITELRGELPLSVGTAEAAALVINSLDSRAS